MSHYQTAAAASQDLVSHVLKWILLAVAIICFALFFWATAVTYERAPPQPGQVVATDGTAVMNATDIVAGKAGFQKADLMDYGSLYGMGSYFGQDYTAFALMRIATLTEENLAEMRFGKGFGTLASEQQASVRDAMRRDLQGIDLTKAKVTLPQEVAAAIGRLRSDIAENLGKIDLHHRLDAGLQPWPCASTSDCRLHYLFGIDHRGSSPRYDMVVDRKLAI